MLAAMEQNDDPFHNPPPPSRSARAKDSDVPDDTPDRFKPSPNPNPAQPPSGLSQRERSKIYDEEKRKRRKKKRKAPSNPEEANNGYNQGRKGSIKSTGTYTVDQDDKQLIPPSPVKSGSPVHGYLQPPEDAVMSQTARSQEYAYMTARGDRQVP